jgi:hypothetical protein
LKNKHYHSDELEMLVRDADSHFEQVISLYYRALARLVAVAQQVEAAIASEPVVQAAPKLQAKIRSH